ncbi:cc-nbs-lrr resistance protein [Corchorus olitorius]|uniref:Cc-nbs-lrr resistance protein n=1 Tax=Corchorus olitorius TaxID=93759 RepID=A0A1R3JZ60_9ROSI|nr:cc-nbs-lrr resistance protein [Corchorus olitorius]
MADAIVSAVLNQLLTIIDREIEHEVRLVVGIEQEVEKMRNTFQTIQAVLVDAENRHLKEDAVKLWLDKLKHISYDIDDVLDEWNTAILKSKIKRDDQAQGSSWPKRRVQSPSTSFDLSSKTLEEVVLQEGGSFYETETSSSCSLKDLGKLIHLRGNLKIFGLGNVEEASEAKEARLSTKTGLQSLSLRFDVINAEPKQNTGRTEDEAFVLQALQPPQNLQILEMGFCEVMPKLERLSILECPLLKTLPRHLLQTGALKELVIRKNHSIFRRHFNKETGEGMTALGL